MSYLVKVDRESAAVVLKVCLWPIAEVKNRTGVGCSCVKLQKHSQKQRRRIKYAAIPPGAMRKPLETGILCNLNTLAGTTRINNKLGVATLSGASRCVSSRHDEDPIGAVMY